MQTPRRRRSSEARVAVKQAALPVYELMATLLLCALAALI